MVCCTLDITALPMRLMALPMWLLRHWQTGYLPTAVGFSLSLC